MTRGNQEVKVRYTEGLAGGGAVKRGEKNQNTEATRGKCSGQRRRDGERPNKSGAFGDHKQILVYQPDPAEP